MLGRSVSVVTLEGGTTGLASNYVKVTLARRRDANRLEDVRIGGLTADGLSEVGVMPVLTS